jgi:hypothetical protein
MKFSVHAQPLSQDTGMVNFTKNPNTCPLNPSEKRQEGERAKSRDMLAIEAHRWKSWNTDLFSHRDARNRLDSLTQDTKQCSKFMNSKWHHKFAKHNTTPRYVYQSVSKNFVKFFLLFPHSQLLTVQVSVFLFPAVWPGLYWFPGSLVLWLCGPLAMCLFLVSAFRSMCCLLDYLLGPGSLGSLVGGVEWCYSCWDPARMFNEVCEQGLSFCILLSLFICLLLFLGLMPCCWWCLGDRLVLLQGCYWGRGHHDYCSSTACSIDL